MSDLDQQELRLKQNELFVAQQIFNELSYEDKQVLHIEPLPLNDIAAGGYIQRDFVYQQTGLQRLIEKGLIQRIDASTTLGPGIAIRIVDSQIFKSFYSELYESIPSTGNGVRIIYSAKTGEGKINGQPFKLNSGSRNRKVFTHLAKYPNRYLTKQKLWIVAGEKHKFNEEDPDKVAEFNTIITKLRSALKNISPNHLRLKEKVMLVAEVTLTD